MPLVHKNLALFLTILADIAQRCPGHIKQLKNQKFLLTFNKQYKYRILQYFKTFNKMIRNFFTFIALFAFINGTQMCPSQKNNSSCGDRLSENFSLIDSVFNA
jgi:hypothetical protein